MGPTELISIASILATLLISLVIPWLARRRAARNINNRTDLVSWQSITTVLQTERDNLRLQLDQAQGENRKVVRELDAEHMRQMAQARQRILLLEQEVNDLRRTINEYDSMNYGYRREDDHPNNEAS